MTRSCGERDTHILNRLMWWFCHFKKNIIKLKTSYVTNCRWLYLWRLRNFLSFYAHCSSSFLTSRSWRIKTNLLKSVWLNHHKITKLTVQAQTRVKITPSAACSFKPNHLKILYTRVTASNPHHVLYEPTWDKSYLPRAIKPTKRIGKIHLAAGCISPRVVWVPSSLFFWKELYRFSRREEEITWNDANARLFSGAARPALPARSFLIRSELDLARPSPMSAKLPSGASIRTPHGEGKTALTIALKGERCNLTPWMTGRSFKSKARRLVWHWWQSTSCPHHVRFEKSKDGVKKKKKKIAQTHTFKCALIF